MKKLEFTNEQIEEVKNLYQEGLSAQAIGIKFEVSKPTILKILSKENIVKKPPSFLDPKKVELFIDTYNKTYSVLEAREVSGLGQDTALRIVKEQELDKNKKCIYCGSIDLFTMKNGRTYPCCNNCKDIHFSKIDKDRIETNLEKYGEERVVNVQEMKNKTIQTNLGIYGTPHPMQNKEFYEQYKINLYNNKGVINTFQDEEVKEKIKQFNLINYGVDHVSKVPEVQQKRLETFKNKYGSTCSFNTLEIRKKMNKTNREAYWSTFNKLLTMKNVLPNFTKEYYLDSNNKIFNYLCKECNTYFDSESITPQKIICGCMQHRSYMEYQLENWLISLNIKNIEPNKRKFEDSSRQLEADIYLPDFKLGIDLHGIFWHSEIHKRNDYHKNKYLYFLSLGIQFIQVFENEWEFKQDIVKSIIKNKLGMNEKIFARKCEIKEITYNDTRDFLDINHLQGNINGRYNIGLYYENELVCVSVFGINRFKKDESIELLRFCNKINFTVIGGFNKLLKYFEKTYTPKLITSYIDLRYFTGNGYNTNGFVNDGVSEPNYFYFHNSTKLGMILHNRMEFQKHKLKDKLKNFDENKSEHDNMLDNGYLRIYDVGNMRMIKTY